MVYSSGKKIDSFNCIADNQPLLGLTASELEEYAVNFGQPAFRGRQIHNWLYAKGAKHINEMTVLPEKWRLNLNDRGVRVGRPKEIQRLVSSDSTTKLLLQTEDGESIETVGIPTPNRLTVCVSSQIGCAMSCRFCATGKGGLRRSLDLHEIVGQVLSIREAMDRKPSHIVFMGMGEPLMNTESVISSIKCFNQELNIGQRKITISTVGIPKSIIRLAELAKHQLGSAQFTLAISLHAPNQKLREKLIPTAKGYPIDSLLSDCKRYIALTGRRVSFEYILLGNLNDYPEHAEQLSSLVAGFQSHVNLIAYNPIEEEDFSRPSKTKIENFKRILQNRGVAVSIRASRGLDQNAACGQLRRAHSTVV